MSFQGKQLTPEMIELVVHLKKHYDEERKIGKYVSTKDSAGRTATGLGLGIATVKRILAQYARDGDKILTLPAKRPGRPPAPIFQHLQPVVRRFIRAENLAGRRVSIERVGNYLVSENDIDIPRMTLWRALKRWGFAYGEGRRRDSLKEQDYVILARRAYLRAKRSNRNPDGTLKRPEIYLDETYINKNHSSRVTWYFEDDGPWVNKPAGVGPRLIVVHAISKDGWVEGAQLIFEAKKRTGDYHGQMNWENFSKWFQFQLLPNIEPNSVVILDNAKYHNIFVEGRFPKKNSSKEQLRAWLSRNGYAWREDMLKSELLNLCSRVSPAPEYRLDELAAQYGFSILRTPQYHPELQPIETCWAIVKNHMADNCDFTMRGLRERLPEAFEKVTPGIVREIIAKIVEQEDAYWTEDEKLDEEYSANSEEENIGQFHFEDEGLEHYLEEA